MSRFKVCLVAMGAVVALASSALTLISSVSAAPVAESDSEIALPASAAEHAAEAARYEQEALELEAKSQRHAEMAERYQGRSSGGSKQKNTLLSLAAHCKRLAKLYAEAAVEARETARSHRDMTESM
jgi:multidrug efflux pump subunit AcrB